MLSVLHAVMVFSLGFNFCCSMPDKKKKKNNRRSVDESCSNNAHSSGNNSSGAHGAAGNVDRARSRHHPVSAVPPLGSPPVVSSAVPLNSSAPVATPQTVNLENRFDEIAPKLVFVLFLYDFEIRIQTSIKYMKCII